MTNFVRLLFIKTQYFSAVNWSYLPFCAKWLQCV